jgi:hypothetical protein
LGYCAFRVKDEAGYIVKNRMEETENGLLKTAPVEVDMVVASSWAEK